MLRADEVELIFGAERAERAAMEDFYRFGLRPCAARAVHQAGALALLAPTFSSPLFNRVLGLGANQEVTSSDVEALVTLYEDAGARELWIQLAPLTQPPELSAWLTERSFTLAARAGWGRYVRECGALQPAPTSLHIRAAEREDAARIGDIVARTYGWNEALQPCIASLVGRAGWLWFVGCLETNEPVVAGAMYVFEGMGWLGFAATEPEHRRRGGQSALLTARIEAAGALGCHHVFVETGEPIGAEPNPSRDNLQRLGFRQISQCRNYTRRLTPPVGDASRA